MDPTHATAAFAAELIEAITHGVSVVNPAGQHVLVNEAFCSMTGCSRDELLHNQPMEFAYWPPEEADNIASAFQRMVSGDYGPYELVFCRKSGERFPCRVAPGQAQVDGETLYIATVQDLTEERRDKARMAELSQLLDNMTHAGDLATWEWSLVEDHVRVSDSWYTQLGETPAGEFVTTGTLVERVHPDDFPATQREIEALLANEVRLYEVEHRLRLRSGDYHWFLARGFITERAPDGTPLRIGGTNQNIHRFKLQEAHLRQYQKMEVLGQITGGIAHDFNNLLQVLYGNLEELLMDGPEEQRQDLEAMGDALDRATNLTRSLLRYVRKQRPTPERVEVDGLVEAAKSVLTTATTAEVELRFELDGASQSIEIEPSDLENALLNLVVNAREATRQTAKGQIVVSTGYRDITNEEGIEYGCAPGAYVTITVADNGAGMSDEVRHRATEPLYTTRSTGTGLGLSMVQRFVREAGGFLHLDSAPGKGTRVMLGFPGAVDRPGLDESEEAKDAAAARTSARVLLVDDEESLLQALAPGLEALGYEVLTAERPGSALDLLEQHPIDVVVTDIAMPYSLNGVGLAHRVRTLKPGLPILFMTGFATPLMEEEAKTIGPVLWKPFQVGELANHIRKALEPVEKGSG